MAGYPIVVPIFSSGELMGTPEAILVVVKNGFAATHRWHPHPN